MRSACFPKIIRVLIQKVRNIFWSLFLHPRLFSWFFSLVGLSIHSLIVYHTCETFQRKIKLLVFTLFLKSKIQPTRPVKWHVNSRNCYVKKIKELIATYTICADRQAIKEVTKDADSWSPQNLSGKLISIQIFVPLSRTLFTFTNSFYKISYNFFYKLLQFFRRDEVFTAPDKLC